MTEIGKIEIPVEAKIKVRVGEHEVELDELAAALTKAGVTLQAITAPQRAVDATTYASAKSVSVPVDPLDALRAGEGIVRDRDGRLHSIEVEFTTYTPNAMPRIAGHITGRI